MGNNAIRVIKLNHRLNRGVKGVLQYRPHHSLHQVVFTDIGYVEMLKQHSLSYRTALKYLISCSQVGGSMWGIPRCCHFFSFKKKMNYHHLCERKGTIKVDSHKIF